MDGQISERDGELMDHEDDDVEIDLDRDDDADFDVTGLVEGKYWKLDHLDPYEEIDREIVDVDLVQFKDRDGNPKLDKDGTPEKPKPQLTLDDSKLCRAVCLIAERWCEDSATRRTSKNGLGGASSSGMTQILGTVLRRGC